MLELLAQPSVLLDQVVFAECLSGIPLPYPRPELTALSLFVVVLVVSGAASEEVSTFRNVDSDVRIIASTEPTTHTNMQNTIWERTLFVIASSSASDSPI